MKKNILELTLIDPSGHDRTFSIEAGRIYRLGRVIGDSDILMKDLDLPNHVGQFRWSGETQGPRATIDFRIEDQAPSATLFGISLKAFSLPISTEVTIAQTSFTFARSTENRALPPTPSSVKAWKTRSETGAKLLWDTKKVAATPLSVYLNGETGTGKEVLAHLLHAWSDRASGPFIPINCGALPLGLVESELFGHVKGAFTGADQSRAGAFLLAHNGTLFLDEVGNLSPEVQVKLLRFLEDGEIRAVGSDRVVHSNVRLICATHLPLPKLVEEGKFRKDLYYRIASCTIKIPALRDRPEDIELLANEFAGQFKKSLPPQTLDRLKSYSWPGNVRELRHAIERACGLAGPFQEALTEDLFEFESVGETDATREQLDPLAGTLRIDEMEKKLLIKALRQSDGNRQEAARLLGVARSTVFEMIKRYRIASYRTQVVYSRA